MNRSTIFTNSAGSVPPCKVHQQKSRMNLGSRLRSNETSKKGWGCFFFMVAIDSRIFRSTNWICQITWLHVQFQCLLLILLPLFWVETVHFHLKSGSLASAHLVHLGTFILVWSPCSISITFRLTLMARNRSFPRSEPIEIQNDHLRP